MIVDAGFDFGLPAITNSNTATVSTNVYDAGSAILLFGASRHHLVPLLQFRTPVSVDTTAVRIDLVGADNAALSSNPHVIASKYITHDELGAALGTGTQNIEGHFACVGQTAAKRYYGLMVTLVGTNPDMTAGDAQVVYTEQSNMNGARAAVPA